MPKSGHFRTSANKNSRAYTLAEIRTTFSPHISLPIARPRTQIATGRPGRLLPARNQKPIDIDPSVGSLHYRRRALMHAIQLFIFLFSSFAFESRQNYTHSSRHSHPALPASLVVRCLRVSLSLSLSPRSRRESGVRVSESRKHGSRRGRHQGSRTLCAQTLPRLDSRTSDLAIY